MFELGAAKNRDNGADDTMKELTYEPEEFPQGQKSLVEVPLSALSSDALLGLVEEYVTRDGTDYGFAEKTLRDKCEALLEQLRSGEAVVVFDLALEAPNIVMRETMHAKDQLRR